MHSADGQLSRKVMTKTKKSNSKKITRTDPINRAVASTSMDASASSTDPLNLEHDLRISIFVNPKTESKGIMPLTNQVAALLRAHAKDRFRCQSTASGVVITSSTILERDSFVEILSSSNLVINETPIAQRLRYAGKSEVVHRFALHGLSLTALDAEEAAAKKRLHAALIDQFKSKPEDLAVGRSNGDIILLNDFNEETANLIKRAKELDFNKQFLTSTVIQR